VFLMWVSETLNCLDVYGWQECYWVLQILLQSFTN
jgi:hypothetical protein